MKADVMKDIVAAQQNGVKNIEYDFTRGVSPDVQQAIEKMGKQAGINITITTQPVSTPDVGNTWGNLIP
jgi:hypothetical protein